MDRSIGALSTSQIGVALAFMLGKGLGLGRGRYLVDIERPVIFTSGREGIRGTLEVVAAFVSAKNNDDEDDNNDEDLH
jgi:hypothetical protein